MVGAVGAPNTHSHTADALLAATVHIFSAACNSIWSCVFYQQKNQTWSQRIGETNSEHGPEKLLFVLLKEIKFHLDTYANSSHREWRNEGDYGEK